MNHTHDCQIAVSTYFPFPDGSRKSVAAAGAVPSTSTSADRSSRCWHATPSAAARLSAVADTFARGHSGRNASLKSKPRKRGLIDGVFFTTDISSRSFRSVISTVPGTENASRVSEPRSIPHSTRYAPSRAGAPAGSNLSSPSSTALCHSCAVGAGGSRRHVPRRRSASKNLVRVPPMSTASTTSVDDGGGPSSGACWWICFASASCTSSASSCAAFATVAGSRRRRAKRSRYASTQRAQMSSSAKRKASTAPIRWAQGVRTRSAPYRVPAASIRR